MKDIILLGGGGHCKSVIDVIEQEAKFQIKGILDVAEKVGESVLDYPIVGTEDDLPRFIEGGAKVLVTVGQVKSSALRQRLFELVKLNKGTLATVVSPLAYVSKYAQVGEGGIIMHGAIVNAGATIGRNTIINSRTLIEHDAAVGDHCHIATGAIINGDCQIGNQVLIGSRSVLRQGVKICDSAIVGMGSLVLHDIKYTGTYFGNPVKERTQG
ncbi:acetyltransferase [Porifericola rhodea]|uniref:acetyltransferase n=1 Tax=Porifericola rhodea TaxID=930972 RepID=UPI002664FDF6|nr:acetyltransferase [Porifericola rhodea]WKN32228.1 acetyltransferase [Porifericola rhodea]